MILEFSCIQTLEGVTRTPYNQYESVILTLKVYLEKSGVNFQLKCNVTDFDFDQDNNISVVAIHYKAEKGLGMIPLQEGDLCIVTNGCMTDNSKLGSLKKAALLLHCSSLVR